MKKKFTYIIFVALLVVGTLLMQQQLKPELTQNEAGYWFNQDNYLTDEKGEILSSPANSPIERQ